MDHTNYTISSAVSNTRTQPVSKNEMLLDYYVRMPRYTTMYYGQYEWVIPPRSGNAPVSCSRRLILPRMYKVMLLNEALDLNMMHSLVAVSPSACCC